MNKVVDRGIGLYRILGKIGAGGMSTVYKGYDATRNRYAAIKVMPEQMSVHDELRQRFRQEVRLISRLKHPHILPIYDYGLEGSRLYMATRYVEGGTLGDRLAQGPMDLAEVSRVLHQVGAALAYAHRKGVIHRDIKPRNVLLDAQGDCYLGDFGLAKTNEASIRLTATGVGLGTPAYMSPEQGKGQQVDARSDLYSLGCMLYEMVTGEVPFTDRSPVRVMLQHITEPVPPPSSRNVSLPPELDAVILKALAKQPQDRFQSVAEMLDAFDAVVEPASPPVARTPDRPQSPVWKTLPVWAWAALGCFVLAVLVAGGMLLPRVATGEFWGGSATETVDGTAAAALVGTATATSSPSPSATPSPTASATAVPTHTPRPTSTTQPTSTAAPTATPTVTSTITPTATPAATPTATQAPTHTPTHTPTATPTAPPTATVRWLPAPALLEPPEGKRFVGWDAKVVLRWSAVAGMEPDEYYVVRIPYDDAGGVAEFWRQETALQLPPIFALPTTGFADRHYHWMVQVMQCVENCERLRDDNARKEGREAGDLSEIGLFYWDPDL